MTRARGVAAGVAALACAAALAQGADSPERRALQQKEALVRRLVFDSPAEQRIAASGNEAARAELVRARSLHARAIALADAGDLAGAQAELNAAMWAVGKARQLAPDPAARAVDLRVRYAGLLRTVETLARSYEANAARMGAAGADPRLAAARASQEQASGLAATEHMEEAVRALERAERELMAGLNAMLGSSTLQYAKRFETQAEEHGYELERNRSYRELVPVAIAELKPRREAVVLVERYVAANARQLEAAEGHAAAGRLPEAIDALRTGTNSLQAALAAAGLAVPRNIGAN
ncbi:MAG: hypothetical protein NDI88_07240 [Lysobacter sp.]|nr:hypothetical protein [Lysobacter sp.]